MRSCTPLLALLALFGTACSADTESRSYAGDAPAPEFPEGLDWLNTGGKPLSLEELRGKVVLLDFWTYGCINCIHIIPDLKKLEASFPSELVVIGVHSAKFANEGRTSNIRRFMQRYDIAHPVVNDRDFQIWDAYGASGWPTLALIDPKGKLVGTVSGEGHYQLLDTVIGGLVEEFEIDRSPIGIVLEIDAGLGKLLYFPGKVLADARSRRLFIADTSHHRIVVSDLDGTVQDVIGSGAPGLADGGYAEAGFFLPQGMSLAGPDTLYVADTENHAVRRIHLTERRVETAAGTGTQGYLHRAMGPAASTSLNSPWDVLFHQGVVYIAMAGQHQIWVYDPESNIVREFAGSRREELKDGALLKAGLNQPSALTTDGEALYIADSEASAIRKADLRPDGKVRTIVGTGLFDFGDVDGAGDQVRLQHPLGIAYHDSALFVADTYNSKLKRIDPRRRRSKTFAGAGGEFDEPGGLSIAAGRIYVADTNHHAIKVVDIDTREVAELGLSDPKRLLERRSARALRGE